MILLCFFIKKSNAPQIKSYFIKLLLCFVNSLSTHLHLIVDDFLKKSWASFLHIPPGRIEIAGVPRIGYLAGTVGKVHQQMHLVGKIAAADAVHTPQVGMNPCQSEGRISRSRCSAVDGPSCRSNRCHARTACGEPADTPDCRSPRCWWLLTRSECSAPDWPSSPDPS